MPGSVGGFGSCLVLGPERKARVGSSCELRGCGLALGEASAQGLVLCPEPACLQEDARLLVVGELPRGVAAAGPWSSSLAPAAAVCLAAISPAQVAQCPVEPDHALAQPCLHRLCRVVARDSVAHR